MRTTLAIDDDVAALLERLRKQQHAGLRELVNEAARERRY
jgi:Ribbon-helix-helix protein, copG family